MMDELKCKAWTYKSWMIGASRLNPSHLPAQTSLLPATRHVIAAPSTGVIAQLCAFALCTPRRLGRVSLLWASLSNPPLLPAPESIDCPLLCVTLWTLLISMSASSQEAICLVSKHIPCPNVSGQYIEREGKENGLITWQLLAEVRDHT